MVPALCSSRTHWQPLQTRWGITEQRNTERNEGTINSAIPKGLVAERAVRPWQEVWGAHPGVLMWHSELWAGEQVGIGHRMESMTLEGFCSDLGILCSRMLQTNPAAILGSCSGSAPRQEQPRAPKQLSSIPASREQAATTLPQALTSISAQGQEKPSSSVPIPAPGLREGSWAHLGREGSRQGAGTHLAL